MILTYIVTAVKDNALFEVEVFLSQSDASERYNEWLDSGKYSEVSMSSRYIRNDEDTLRDAAGKAFKRAFNADTVSEEYVGGVIDGMRLIFDELKDF